MTATRKDQLRFGKAAHSNAALKRKKILLGAIVAVIVLASVTLGIYLLASYLWSSTNSVPKGNGQKVKVNDGIKGKKPKEKQRRSGEESTVVGRDPFGGAQQVGLNTFDQAAWQRQQQQAYWVRAEQDRLRDEQAYRWRQQQGVHWRPPNGDSMREWHRRAERQRQEAWQRAHLSRSQDSRQQAQPWQPEDSRQRAQPWQPEDSRQREDADGRSAEQERLIAEQADRRTREEARLQTEMERMRANEELDRMRRMGVRQAQLREEDEARWREEQDRSRAGEAVTWQSDVLSQEEEQDRLKAEREVAESQLQVRDVLGQCGAEQGDDDRYDGILESVRWLTVNNNRIEKAIGIKHSMMLMKYQVVGGLRTTNRVAVVQKCTYGVDSTILCTGKKRDCNLDTAQGMLRQKFVSGTLKSLYDSTEMTGAPPALHWRDHETNIISTVPGKLRWDLVHSNSHHYAESIWYMISGGAAVRMPNRDKIRNLIHTPWTKRRMKFDCLEFDNGWIDTIRAWYPEPEEYLRWYCLEKGWRKDEYKPHRFVVERRAECQWLNADHERSPLRPEEQRAQPWQPDDPRQREDADRLRTEVHEAQLRLIAEQANRRAGEAARLQTMEAEQADRWRPVGAGARLREEHVVPFGAGEEGSWGMEQVEPNQYEAVEWPEWVAWDAGEAIQLSPEQLEQLRREQTEEELRMMGTWQPDWESQANDGDAWSFGFQGSPNDDQLGVDDYPGELHKARWLVVRQGGIISRRIGIKHSMILMQYRSAAGLIRVVVVQKLKGGVSSEILCTQPRDEVCNLDEAERVVQEREKRPYVSFRDSWITKQHLYWRDHDANIISTVPGKLPYDFVNSNCHHYAASIWHMAFLGQDVWYDIRMPNRDYVAKLTSVPNPWTNRRMKFNCNDFDPVWISTIEKWHPQPHAYLREYCLNKRNDKDPFEPRNFKVIGDCPWIHG